MLMCPKADKGASYGLVWNWFVEKLVDLNHVVVAESCLLCAMDCNPKVRLIDICMPAQERTAIPEPKVRTASCSSNKMNQPQSPKRQKNEKKY